MTLRRWLAAIWYWQLRKMDIAFLWWPLLRQVKDLDTAKAVFMMHCAKDPAWQALGRKGMIAAIDKLSADGPLWRRSEDGRVRN